MLDSAADIGLYLFQDIKPISTYQGFDMFKYEQTCMWNKNSIGPRKFGLRSTNQSTLNIFFVITMLRLISITLAKFLRLFIGCFSVKFQATTIL